MQEHEKTLISVLVAGALIGLGKLLVSKEELTVRLCFGRSILGAATSSIAGLALIQIPNLHPIALLGIGSALGIVGAQFVELWFKKQANKINGG
ncbi:phage holin family protein [Deefgea piscis]|uniref:phage holin family protein n=1 Tax=Deefgea piscis TaxID=2739061 RepID=UPI001C7E8B77|nr:phage holin family protein [Deefgea piscis]QZA80225.1 phage holin family protein [Deefgea piscis]